MQARDACLFTQFAAAPLEELRWPIIATSLGFEAGRWGAPDPLFPYAAPPGEIEDALRERLHLSSPPLPLRVYDVRLPFNGRLEIAGGCDRVQVAQALTPADAAALARACEEAGVAELRLHGMRGEPFDLRVLAQWPHLRSLIVDTENTANPHALGDLQSLQHLALRGGALLAHAPALSQLRSLHVQACADCAPLARLEHLESLAIEGCPRLRIERLRNLPLRSLTLAHEPRDLTGLHALTQLEFLELRDMQLAALPDLSQSRALNTIVLIDVRLLRDLRELLRAPALRRAVLRFMPQLRAPDAAALRALAGSVKIEFDTGNRTIDRELYRSLR